VMCPTFVIDVVSEALALGRDSSPIDHVSYGEGTTYMIEESQIENYRRRCHCHRRLHRCHCHRRLHRCHRHHSHHRFTSLAYPISGPPSLLPLQSSD
jgi:hypothetical protein